MMLQFLNEPFQAYFSVEVSKEVLSVEYCQVSKNALVEKFQLTDIRRKLKRIEENFVLLNLM